jgi:hypothetical protein
MRGKESQKTKKHNNCVYFISNCHANMSYTLGTFSF